MIENRKNWINAPAKNLILVLVGVMLILYMFSACGSPPWWKAYGFKSYDEVTKPTSVTVLVGALGSDNDSYVRQSAAEALGEIGPQAGAAVPALIRALLSDANTGVRITAAEALEKLGPVAKESVPSLMRALRGSEHYAIRINAARALADLGVQSAEVVAALITGLDSRLGAYWNKRAAETLRKIGPESKKAGFDLLMASSDSGVRNRTLSVIREIGLESNAEVLALSNALNDNHVDMRITVVQTLAQVDPMIQVPVPVFIKALGDSDSRVRLAACQALGKRIPTAKQAVPALIKAFEDSNRFVRYSAVSVLGQIGPEAKEAVPALMQALDDNDVRIRYWACEALGKIGPSASKAAPTLVKTMGDQDDRVRAQAIKAIGRVKAPPELVGPALTAALDDPKPEIRKEALSALELVDYRGHDLLEALEQVAARDPDNTLRKLASHMHRKMRFTALASAKPLEPAPAPTPAPADTTPAPAPSTGGFSQRWAVVIGVSRYQDTRIPALRYASVDAKSLCEWLTSPQGGRYAPSRVNLLLDRDATARNIRGALFEWLGQALEEDIVTVYFAGHGSPQSPDHPENLFLLPYDAQYDNIASTGFPMWDIETALKRFIKAKRVVVIADACHAAGVGNSFDLARRAGRGIKVNPISAGLQNLSQVGEGVCVISASDEKQLSQEGKRWGGGHGVFTYFLLQGLEGQADYNKDTKVTLGELIPFLSEQVRRATRNAQSPIVAGQFDPALTMAR